MLSVKERWDGLEYRILKQEGILVLNVMFSIHEETESQEVRLLAQGYTEW